METLLAGLRAAAEPTRTRLLALCADPDNTLVLSVASVWEMQIKVQLGKLDLDRPLTGIVEGHLLGNQTSYCLSNCPTSSR